MHIHLFVVKSFWIAFTLCKTKRKKKSFTEISILPRWKCTKWQCLFVQFGCLFYIFLCYFSCNFIYIFKGSSFLFFYFIFILFWEKKCSIWYLTSSIKAKTHFTPMVFYLIFAILKFNLSKPKTWHQQQHVTAILTHWMKFKWNCCQ